jgi:hypothetical protein
MTYKLPTLFAAAMLGIGSLQVQAQTVTTFDDLSLPGADTSYLEVIPAVNGIYPFQSGNAKFYGKLDFGGGYQAQFNYSNRTDTLTPGYENQWAAITGKGYDNSANYGIAYAESDMSNFYQSVENGPKLTGAAAGHKVSGVYITNTTVGYRWIKTNFTAGSWYKVTVRGYLNNVRTADSVVVTMASYGATDTTLLNTWQWVNLLPLGNVDSLTFQTSSSNSFTPYYFAIDNLTTLDGVCPDAQSIAATSVNENSATVTWTNSITGFTSDYEVTIDQSATLAPAATAATVTSPVYSKNGLSANTLYYVHVRTACEGGTFSAWDTASFKTLQSTGIFNGQSSGLQLSISPNPATDMLVLNSAIPVNAVVYSIEGKMLLQAANATRISVAALPAGVYLLRVTDKADTGKQATLRFTKRD